MLIAWLQAAVGAMQRVAWRGLAAVEHTGTSDGLCLTKVIAIQADSSCAANHPCTRSSQFSWKVLDNGSIKTAILTALSNKVYPSITF